MIGLKTTLTGLRGQLEARLRAVVALLARLLAPLGVTANMISITGCLLSIVAALLLASEQLLLAGVLFLFASTLDVLDGSMARFNGQASNTGAFLDSSLDRIAEGAIFGAAIYYFHAQGQSAGIGVSVLAWIGAYLTSYTRARGQSLGYDCTGGLIKRAERVVILGVGLVGEILLPAMVLLAVLGTATAAYRLIANWKNLRAKDVWSEGDDDGDDSDRSATDTGYLAHR